MHMAKRGGSFAKPIGETTHECYILSRKTLYMSTSIVFLFITQKKKINGKFVRQKTKLRVACCIDRASSYSIASLSIKTIFMKNGLSNLNTIRLPNNWDGPAGDIHHMDPKKRMQGSTATNTRCRTARSRTCRVLIAQAAPCHAWYNSINEGDDFFLSDFQSK